MSASEREEELLRRAKAAQKPKPSREETLDELEQALDRGDELGIVFGRMRLASLKLREARLDDDDLPSRERFTLIRGGRDA